MGSAQWSKGVPTAAMVAQHEKAHPLHDESGHYIGSLWLCVWRGGSFGGAPHLIRLRVGKSTDYVLESDDGKYVSGPGEGRVLLANGFSMWQLLEPCRWATAAEYAPCDSSGVALPPTPSKESEP